MLETIGGIDWALWFGILFAASEVIGMIPGVQASGVFQAVYNTLKAIKNFVGKKPEA